MTHSVNRSEGRKRGGSRPFKCSGISHVSLYTFLPTTLSYPSHYYDRHRFLPAAIPNANLLPLPYLPNEPHILLTLPTTNHPHDGQPRYYTSILHLGKVLPLLSLPTLPRLHVLFRHQLISLPTHTKFFSKRSRASPSNFSLLPPKVYMCVMRG